MTTTQIVEFGVAMFGAGMAFGCALVILLSNSKGEQR